MNNYQQVVVYFPRNPLRTHTFATIDDTLRKGDIVQTPTGPAIVVQYTTVLPSTPLKQIKGRYQFKAESDIPDLDKYQRLLKLEATIAEAQRQIELLKQKS